MKKFLMLYCIALALTLLGYCANNTAKDFSGDRSISKSDEVEMVSAANGQIIYSIDRQTKPLQSEKSIRVYKEIRAVSPEGEAETTSIPIGNSNRTPTETLPAQLPILSPNGQSQMFIEGNKLVTADADGSNKAEIGEYRELSPESWQFAWSRDSQRLAYGLYDSVFVTGQDGSRQAEAADSELRQTRHELIGWSGSGQYLLTYEQLNQSAFQIHRVAIPDSLPVGFTAISKRKRMKLAAWPIDDFHGCNVHANGYQLACSVEQGTVKLISIETGEQEDFLPKQFAELSLWSAPEWSSDGKMIAFITQESDKSEVLWVMPAEGRGPRQKVAQSWSFRVWQWSPDGQELLFSTYPTRVDGFEINQGFFAFSAETQATRTIVEPGEQGVAITSASWQPLPK